MVKYTAVSKKKLILIVGVALIIVAGSFCLGKYTTKSSSATKDSQSASSEEYSLLAKRIFFRQP